MCIVWTNQCVLSILQHKMVAVCPTATGVKMLKDQLQRKDRLSAWQQIYPMIPKLYGDLQMGWYKRRNGKRGMGNMEMWKRGNSEM